MNKIIPIAITVAIIVGIATAIIYFFEQSEPEIVEKPWVWSGPFAINKNQYKIGEKIFINIVNLRPDDIGEMQFYLPDGRLWDSIPFNGTEKSGFKKYFEPDTSRSFGIYEPEELVGIWRVVLNGTSYQPIMFEIINEYEPGEELDVISIPRNP